MSNQLVKADAKRKKEGNPFSLLSALGKGGPAVWISCVLMGFGNLCAGQLIKGLIFLAIEVAFIGYMFLIPSARLTGGGTFWLKKMVSLGDIPTEEVWDENEMVYKYLPGDDSPKILLYAVATICICVAFAIVWQMSVRSGYRGIATRREGKKPLTFWGDIKELFDGKLHALLMTPPFLGLCLFTIVPLIYMILMAFTSYDFDHFTKFDWVGVQNFKDLIGGQSSIGNQFWRVLGWTLIWAFFATFLNFFFGTFVAMIINRPTTRLKPLWRTIFSLTVAIPQFVSLLIIRSMFSDDGIINLTLRDWGLPQLLHEWGWIRFDDRLPFLADWARVTVIIINLWVGIPFTIMQVTGILQNIPADLYEAAKIDGANVVQQFMNITLPYMIFVMTPYIITSFTGNINNFNVIFLLTGGGPTVELTKNAAGKTDLLVTWLYNLSMSNEPNYKLAATIGIMTFVILAIVSLITYRSSGSYKDEEGFK